MPDLPANTKLVAGTDDWIARLRRTVARVEAFRVTGAAFHKGEDSMSLRIAAAAGSPAAAKGFAAEITGRTQFGDGTQRWLYDWTEVTIATTSVDASTDTPDQPRSSADLGKAVNAAELVNGSGYSQGQQIAPIPTNSIVHVTLLGGVAVFEQRNRLANVCVAVTVEQTGGSAGNKTTQCSFTYTVKDQAGVSLGTDVSPAMARPSAGKLVAATKGMAWWDAAGSMTLLWVDEAPARGACS